MRNGSSVLVLVIASSIVLNAAAGARSSDAPVKIAMSDEVRSMCRQAEQLINSRQIGRAIKILNRAARLDPNCPEVHGYLGLAYQNSLKTEKAIEEYSTALRINPRMSFIKINLGTCYMNMRQPQRAIPLFQQYLQEMPNGPDAPRARMYLQQAGVREQKNNLRSLIEKGQALMNQKRYPQAKQAFEQALSQNPNFAPGHFYLGYTLSSMGSFQAAIAEFQKCLQLDPSSSQALMNIGSCYQSMGDARSAISWYQRYLQENPRARNARDIEQRIKGLQEQARKQAATRPGQYPGQIAAGQPVGRQYQGQYGGPLRPQYPGQSQMIRQQPAFPQQGFERPRQVAPAQQSDYVTSAASGGRYFRWPVGSMPLKVYIGNGSGSAGYRDSFRKMLTESMSTWAEGSQNRISFTEVSSPSQANIQLSWTDNPAKVVEKGRAVEGGLTKISGQPLPDGTNVNITRARIIILTRRQDGQQMSDDDMKKVCLHELGHALGISGHSSNNKDIMFFSEAPSVWPALTKRDKATICRLYANHPILQPPARAY